ncbi:MAG: hypothetical protein P4L83_10230 [Nevskia sp.]|nr:hypothetical protein [Nevskia sp.]
MLDIFGRQQTGENITELRYLRPDGKRCITRLQAGGVKGLGTQFQSTSDPLWITSCEGAPRQWLAYMGLDKRWWWSRVRAEFDDHSKLYVFSFEHRGPGESADAGPENLGQSKNRLELKRIGFHGTDGESRYYATIGTAALAQTPSFEVVKLT